MQTSIITQAIEWLLDKFKAKHGSAWIIIMAVLTAIYYGVSFLQANNFAGIVIPANIAHIVDLVLLGLAGLVGSSTQAKQKAADQGKKTI